MFSRVLILKGTSKYNVLRFAADCMAEGFKEAGCEVTVVDTTAQNFAPYEILNAEYDLCVMPQAFLFDLKLKDGSTFASHLPGTVVGWIFDDVLYHFERVLYNRYPNLRLLSIDGAANRIVADMGLCGNESENGVNRIGTLLHGGFMARNPYAEKTIDVLCPCTLGKEPDGTGVTAKPFADEAIELWKRDPQLSARQALGKVLKLYGEKLEGNLLYHMTDTILYINSVMRYLCRQYILEKLMESGLNVHLIGEIYGFDKDGKVSGEEEQSGKSDKVVRYGEHLTVHGPMDISEVTELIAHSKILVNPFPNVYEEGAHERIFTAMLNNCVCFTPKHEFTEKMLGDRLEYIDFHDMDDAIERMRELVTHFEDYEGPIENNYLYAFDNHTWQKRAKQLMEII